MSDELRDAIAQCISMIDTSGRSDRVEPMDYDDADRVIAALRTCLAEKPELLSELGLPSYVPRIIEAMKELQRRRDAGEATQVDDPESLDERLRSLGWVRADERSDA